MGGGWGGARDAYCRGGEQRAQARDIPVGELSRLDLEAVVPVSVPQALEQVATDGEAARLPLSDHVTVLVQHQPGVGEEVRGAAAQVDAPAARRCHGAAVQANEAGMLDDLHLPDLRAEQPLERMPYSLRRARLPRTAHGGLASAARMHPAHARPETQCAYRSGGDVLGQELHAGVLEKTP